MILFEETFEERDRDLFQTPDDRLGFPKLLCRVGVCHREALDSRPVGAQDALFGERRKNLNKNGRFVQRDFSVFNAVSLL